VDHLLHTLILTVQLHSRYFFKPFGAESELTFIAQSDAEKTKYPLKLPPRTFKLMCGHLIPGYFAEYTGRFGYQRVNQLTRGTNLMQQFYLLS